MTHTPTPLQIKRERSLIMTCLHCDQEFEPEEFPFGDDVTCPHCGTVLETDWDYADEDDYDDRACWITGIKQGA